MKTRILLSVLLLALLLPTIVSCGGKDFNYAKADLSPYISLERGDYFGQTLVVTTLKPVSDEDVQKAIDATLYQYKTKANEGKLETDKAVGLGDVVYLYYRGTYMKDGKEIEFSGGSNMADNNPYELQIGTDRLISDLEYGVIGITPADTAFTKTTSGTVDADDVVYFTYTYSYLDTNGEKKTGNVTKQRFDLTAEKVDSAFKQAIIGNPIGQVITLKVDMDFDGDGRSENVEYNGTVVFTAAETTRAIECTFPEDYGSEELAGRDVIFYVVITSMVDYTIPELTPSIVTDTIKFQTTETDVVAAYRASVRKTLEDKLQEDMEAEGINLLWDIMIEKAESTQLPKTAVKKAEKDLLAELESNFDYYNDYYYQMYGFSPWTDLQSFATTYYQLEEGKKYQDYISEVAADVVLEKIIFYYILRTENLTPSKADMDARVKDFLKEMAEYYTGYYGSTITEADVLESYGRDYIEEKLLYDITMEFLAENSNIVLGTPAE